MKIRDLQVLRLKGVRQPSEGFAGWIQCNPSQVFDSSPPSPSRFKASRDRGPMAYEALYLQVLTDTGPNGLYGPIDAEAAIVILRQLKPAVVGMDPLRVEETWERLFRMNRHSRAGHYMMGISAIDNALWDVRGRHAGVPVRTLINPKSRGRVEVYGSCLGYSVEPKAARAWCRKVAGQGFKRQKWFLAYGPSKGRAGMKWNLELVRALRESLGRSTELMFDVFMGWDPEYAAEWAAGAERWNPRWLEEAFMPDRVELFGGLARATPIPIAAGEHLYNRWEVERYLQAGAISVVQADPEWCGGVTELLRICEAAGRHGAIVVPHGHGLHAALEVVAAQSPTLCPYGEYLLNKMDHHHLFEKRPPRAVRGRVALSTRPGFGIELDERRILSRGAFEVPA